MSRNRNSPWPNPEREWYDRNKGKKVRFGGNLQGQNFVDGKLVWVTPYKLGVEVQTSDGRTVIVQLNKAFVAREEPLE